MELTRRDFSCKATWLTLAAMFMFRPGLLHLLELLLKRDDAPVSVTYDAQTKAIIISGGSEKHPATVQDIYGAADRGVIPAVRVGKDIIIGRGVMLQIGDDTRPTNVELSNITIEWA